MYTHVFNVSYIHGDLYIVLLCRLGSNFKRHILRKILIQLHTSSIVGYSRCHDLFPVLVFCPCMGAIDDTKRIHDAQENVMHSMQ
jgi:hypothetical protein